MRGKGLVLFRVRGKGLVFVFYVLVDVLISSTLFVEEAAFSLCIS